MKFTDLEPQFLRYETVVETWTAVDGDPNTWQARGSPTVKKTGPRTHMRFVETFADAQGVWFLCPTCFERNFGKVGTHSIIVSFANRDVTPEQAVHNDKGEPVWWDAKGSGYDDLTVSPSVLVIGGCGAHFFVENGSIRMT